MSALARRTRSGARRAALAAGAIAATLVGCASDPREGYSFAPTFEQKVRTVAVPVFENQTFDTDTEAALTRAIIDEIALRTPWRLDSEARADTTLTGAIRRVDLGVLSIQRDVGLVQEQAYSMTLDFRWIDNRTGDVLASREGLRATSSFVPAVEVGERIDVGREGAIRELAREVVNAMRDSW